MPLATPRRLLPWSLGAVALGLVLSFFAFQPPGDAASICPSVEHAYTCGYPQTVRAFRSIGFSTSGDPCSFDGGDRYGLSISSSSADPNVNVGPITNHTLYLWSWTGANTAYGWDGVLQFQGDLQVQSFERVNGYGDFSSPPIFIWQACGTGKTLIGRLVLYQPIAVESQTWGRMKALYR
jgi:hypothetical protein